MATKKEHKGSFSSRLNDAFEKSNYNKSSLAKALNVTHTTVSRWLNGQTPNGDSLYGLASLMHKNVQWLLTGEGPEEPENLNEALESNAIITDDTFVTVPVLSWAHAGEAMAYEQMPEDYLEPMIIPSNITKGKKVVGITVDGDSMEPNIQHHDQIAILQDASPHNGCIVVAKFREDNGVMVRRYQVLETNKGNPQKVKLIPYNEFYSPTEHHVNEFEWILPVAAVARKLM